MASPFPGMDPYLEDPAFWGDFHHRFIDYWCEAIADVLPDHYEARLDEYVQLVEHRPRRVTLREPDVTVTRKARGKSRPGPSSATATLEPVTIPHVLPSGRRQGYIQVLYGPERSLVAVLELLSPGNKENPGRREYLAKRQTLLHQKVHLVELDLLRGGRRMPLRDPLPQGDYYYLVSRGNRRPNCEVYAWTLRDPLPTLPVPLRAPDPDCQVDLAAVFATVYQRGRYQRSLDYTAPPPVAVDEQTRAWMRQRLRA
jgi:hypothetical protein